MARKKNMPKISVVIPCYNNARFMVQCLDSVVNQTLKDIEIIAINDGSTDETEKIIQEYADVDKRIVFINRKNKGVGYSENEGIKTATGEYVAFLDSDDYYDFKFLENAYNALQGEKLDIVRANRVDFTGSEKHGDYKQAECKHVKDKSYFNKIVNASDKKLFSFANHIWTSIYRRDFLLDNKIFWNEGVSSFNDNGFYFQTLALAETIKYIDVIAVYHRRDNEMSTVKDPDKMFHNFFIEHQFVLEEYKKRNIFEEKKETLIERFYGNYIFAIAVIPFERKFDFIMRASDFFKKMLAENEFDKEKFNNPNVYSKICTYAYLPTEYYNEYIAENYKVSVIVPVFNSEKFLRNTLDCICNQTLKEIEIIFVDDGSTDSSLSIMEEYAKADARITILTQENKGAGAARNLGMQQAHGLYLSFLDADDYFYPTMLKEAFDKGKKENADIVWFKGEEEDFQTKVKKVYSSFFAFDGTRFPNKPVFKFSEISNNPFLSVNGWAWDKLFKRNFIVNKSIKFHEVPITNDAYFTFSALLYAERICTLNKVLISRVIGHEANITLSKHDESPLTQTDELLYIYKMIQEVSLNLTKYWSVKIINSLQWQLANILTNDDSAEIVFDRFAGGYLQEIGIADLDEYEIPELEGRRNNFLFLKRVLEYKPGEFEQFKDSLVNYPITIKTSAGDRELSFLPGRKTGEKIIFRQKAEMGKNTATPFFSITLEKKDWKNCIAQIEFIFLDNNRAAQYDTLYIGAFLRTKNEESEITMYQAQWQCAKKVFAENIFYTVNENTITFFCKYTMSNTGFEYKLRHLTSRDGTGNSILFRLISKGLLTLKMPDIPEDAIEITDSLEFETVTSYEPNFELTNKFYGNRVIFKIDSPEDTAVPLFKITLDEILYNNCFAVIDFTMLNSGKPNYRDTLLLGFYLGKSEKGQTCIKINQKDWENNSILSNFIYFATEGNELTVYGKYTEKYSGYHFRVNYITNRETITDGKYSFAFEPSKKEFIYSELEVLPEGAISAKTSLTNEDLSEKLLYAMDEIELLQKQNEELAERLIQLETILKRGI